MVDYKVIGFVGHFLYLVAFGKMLTCNYILWQDNLVSLFLWIILKYHRLLFIIKNKS